MSKRGRWRPEADADADAGKLEVGDEELGRGAEEADAEELEV